MTPSIGIDSIWLSVPVEHVRPRKRKPLIEVEAISVQVHNDSLWLWDEGCQFQSEIYDFGRKHAPGTWRDLAELPHIDEVYRFAAEQHVANRSNLVGAHLEPAVHAMETTIAARDGSSVYFADAGGQIKIGWSKKVSARLAQLQTGSAVPIKLLGTTPGGRAVERRIHERFAHLRLSGEWFIAAPELLAFIAQRASNVIDLDSRRAS